MAKVRNLTISLNLTIREKGKKDVATSFSSIVDLNNIGRFIKALTSFFEDSFKHYEEEQQKQEGGLK